MACEWQIGVTALKLLSGYSRSVVYNRCFGTTSMLSADGSARSHPPSREVRRCLHSHRLRAVWGDCRLTRLIPGCFLQKELGFFASRRLVQIGQIIRRRSNCLLMAAVDGFIARCGIISS